MIAKPLVHSSDLASFTLTNIYKTGKIIFTNTSYTRNCQEAPLSLHSCHRLYSAKPNLRSRAALTVEKRFYAVFLV